MEEDIDNETLQAKVDASLAYVNDLVSSWMKPPKTPSTSHKDIEKEIELLMRLPPRLGVGAQPPEYTGVSGREAVRLKGRLVGKKRDREHEEGLEKAPSDDEDESRAGAIKKAKLNLFKGRREKKEQKTVNPTPQRPCVLGSSSVPWDVNNRPPTGTESWPQKSYRRNKEAVASAQPATSSAYAIPLNPTMLVEPAVSPQIPHSTAEDSGDDEDSDDLPSEPALHPEGKSVLNLNGPPMDAVDNPKRKKRRRRKRKKHQLGSPHQ